VLFAFLLSFSPPSRITSAMSYISSRKVQTILEEISHCKESIARKTTQLQNIIADCTVLGDQLFNLRHKEREFKGSPRSHSGHAIINESFTASLAAFGIKRKRDDGDESQNPRPSKRFFLLH